MAAIIVNEGRGPQRIELSGLVTLGSNPSCDVVLEDPGALGVRIELKPLKFGYRAKVLKGEVLHNERPCEMADLEHNDTLRIGSVLVLYKQPEGAEGFAGGAGTTPAAASPGVEAELEELSLEELEAPPTPSTVSTASSSADDDLDFLEELGDELVETQGPGQRGAPVEEIDLRQLATADAEAAALAAGRAEVVAEGDGEPAPAPHEVPHELDEALVRAQRKRLAALSRLAAVRAGGELDTRQLSDAAVLAEVAALQERGGDAPLLELERDLDLADATPREILERAETEQRDRAKEALQSFAALESGAAADELEELEELEQLDELDELEPEPTEPTHAEAGAAEPTAAKGDVMTGAGGDLGAAEAASILEETHDEELHELEELDELHELDELEPVEDLEPLPEGAGVTAGAGRGRRSGVRRGGSRGSAAAAAVPTPAIAALPIAGGAFPPPPPSEPPPGSRPLPAGGVRFARPLPAGHAPPRWLPPEGPPPSPVAASPGAPDAPGAEVVAEPSAVAAGAES